MPAGRQPEMCGDGFADIGEAAPAARLRRRDGRRAMPRTGTRSRVWSVPRHVGSQPWSAVSSRRSPGCEPAERLGQAAVEGLERRGIAGDVAPVAVDACRNRRNWRTPGRRRAASSMRAERRVEQRHVVRRPCALPRCPDGRRCRRSCRCRSPCLPRATQPVEQRRLGRRHGIVAPVGRPLEARRPFRRRMAGRSPGRC